MLRSMYSGVSGMRAHQAKMDVIGNNIANVNTYGFKSSRTTFTEVYYQTTKSASGATTSRGGVNASQIGYGVSVGGVDVMQTRSGFQMTDNGMDVAIAGEGFFQVQDADGNIFYTRSGLFRIDPNGNLVDTNGNFVLGVAGDPFGKAAGNDRITISVPNSTPSVPEVTEMINGIAFTVRATNATKDGNVSFNFSSDPTMAIGQKVKATIASNGIQIALNANEPFTTIDEFNSLINTAIFEANGNKEHPAGQFTFSVEDPSKFAGLTGAEVTSTKYTPNLGEVTTNAESTFNELFKPVGVGNTFGSKFTSKLDKQVTYSVTKRVDDYDVLATVTDGSETVYYKQTIPSVAVNSGRIKLDAYSTNTFPINPSDREGDATDFMELTHPGITRLDAITTPISTTTPDVAKVSTPSKALGLSSKAIVLGGGTVGGAQTVSDLTNIGIGSDGVISAIHPQLGLISVGRIDLATFENPQGLTQEGNTYFAESPNSGAASRVNAGTEGSGALQSGALEMSNVDLSKEFAEMITTQRGFQASSRLITVSDEILNELVNLKR